MFVGKEIRIAVLPRMQQKSLRVKLRWKQEGVVPRMMSLWLNRVQGPDEACGRGTKHCMLSGVKKGFP